MLSDEGVLPGLGGPCLDSAGQTSPGSAMLRCYRLTELHMIASDQFMYSCIQASESHMDHDGQDVLEAFAAALAHYRDTRSLGEAEAPLFDAACRALAGSLCPYIAACFAKVYPSAGGAGVDAAKAAAILQERRE